MRIITAFRSATYPCISLAAFGADANAGGPPPVDALSHANIERRTAAATEGTRTEVCAYRQRCFPRLAISARRWNGSAVRRPLRNPSLVGSEAKY